MLCLAALAACAGISVQPYYIASSCGGRGGVIAVGDSVRLSPSEGYETSPNTFTCESPRGARGSWTSSDSRVAAVDSLGWVRALSPGRAVIGLIWNGRQTIDTLVVIPPIRKVFWEPATATMRVGDTLRLYPRVEDAAGAPVETSLRISRRGVFHEMLAISYGTGEPMVLHAMEPGRLVLWAQLGSRMDSAVVTILP
jgi:hypothetical protein